ncbi:MAG: phosphate-starvation-inducible PsiE family protein [Betaproteobacteria bacterium]|jgi:protein PsiE
MLTKAKSARYAQFILEVVENIGLIIIGVATVFAGYHEVMLMIGNGKVTLADLLLMFLYLEVLTMVGLYYNSGKLPVRFPLYIAMVALARYLILDIKDLDVWRMVAVSGSVLLIAIAVLIIRYGHVRFPYSEDGARQADDSRPRYGKE